MVKILLHFTDVTLFYHEYYIFGNYFYRRGGGVNRGIHILSKFESAKSSTMKLQSRIRTKLQAKSTIRAKILDKSAIRCINKICKSTVSSFKIFAKSEQLSVKSDDPKTYSPPPPLYHSIKPSLNKPPTPIPPSPPLEKEIY